MSSTNHIIHTHTEPKDINPNLNKQTRFRTRPHFSNQRTITYTDEDEDDEDCITPEKRKAEWDKWDNTIKSGGLLYHNFDEKNKLIVDNFKRSLEQDYKKKTDRQPKAVPAEEKLISYTDIIANLVNALNIPDTVIGKRSFESEDTSTTLVQLNPILNNKYNIASRRIYMELIMERPLWPRWMKKWAVINADPIQSIIFNNAGNKIIYNLLHKVKKKLMTTSQLAIMNKTTNTNSRKNKVYRQTKEIKSIMPSMRNSLTVKQRRMTRTITNKMKLLLEHYKYHHPSDIWLGRKPLDYERKSYSTDQVKNAAGTLAINSRRETWKRRKRKA
jgi:hypothetical protein